MSLPVIPAIAPSSTPAIAATDAQSFPNIWLTSVHIASPAPGAKKTAEIHSTNYNAATQVISPLPGDVVKTQSSDLDADAARYPAVAQAMSAFVTAVAGLIPAKYYAAKLAAAQAELTSQQRTLANAEIQLGSAQSLLQQQQAVASNPASTPAAIANANAAITRLNGQVANLTATAANLQSAISATQSAIAAAASGLAAAEAALGYAAPAAQAVASVP